MYFLPAKQRVPKLIYYYISIYSRVTDAITSANGKYISDGIWLIGSKIPTLRVSSQLKYYWYSQVTTKHFYNAQGICSIAFYFIGAEIRIFLFAQDAVYAKIAKSFKGPAEHKYAWRENPSSNSQCWCHPILLVYYMSKLDFTHIKVLNQAYFCISLCSSSGCCI